MFDLSGAAGAAATTSAMKMTERLAKCICRSQGDVFDGGLLYECDSQWEQFMVFGLISKAMTFSPIRRVIDQMT